MITGTQIRAAMAGLNLSIATLAQRAGVAAGTVQAAASAAGIPSSKGTTIAAIQGILEAEGVTFAEDGESVSVAFDLSRRG